MLDGFRAFLGRHEGAHLIDLDALLARIEAVARAELVGWATALFARYAAI